MSVSISKIHTLKTALLPASRIGLLHLVLALLVLRSLKSGPLPLGASAPSKTHHGPTMDPIIQPNNYLKSDNKKYKKSSWSCLILNTADRVPPFQQATNVMHVATAKPVRMEVSPPCLFQVSQTSFEHPLDRSLDSGAPERRAPLTMLHGKNI